MGSCDISRLSDCWMGMTCGIWVTTVPEKQRQSFSGDALMELAENGIFVDISYIFYLPTYKKSIKIN